MRRRTIFIVLLIIFLAVFIFSAVQIFRIQREYSKGVEEYDYLFSHAAIPHSSSDSMDESASDKPINQLGFIIDYDELYSLNSDYVGWIYIPNTEINYPIVSCTDNDFYLHRTFLKEYNFAGTLFLDYLTKELGSKNVIIYGHRMNNGSMFADLEKYLEESFYSDNKNIYIFTKNEILVYEIFSSRIVGLEDDCYTIGFSDIDSFNAWVFKMKNQSRYTTTHVQRANGNVITLSTCVRNNETTRNVVQAQLIERLPLE